MQFVDLLNLHTCAYLKYKLISHNSITQVESCKDHGFVNAKSEEFHCD